MGRSADMVHPDGLTERARTVAEVVGWGRVALGILATARPTMLPRMLGSDTGTAQRAAWIVRMFAAREAALGAGTVAALRDGRNPGPWLYAQAAGDVGDALALVAAVRRGHLGKRGMLLALVAAAGAVGDVVAARDLGK
jgi:hypothetical protein